MANKIGKNSRALHYFKKYSLIVIGCFLLAFGDAAFISPHGLVTGGVLSIGVIVQHFVNLSGSDFYVVDIITWGMQIILLCISFAFLGKKYTLRSAFATLLYPALFTLMTRVPLIDGLSLGNHIAQYFITPERDWSLVILAALAGGVCIGLSVAFCYHAGGSSGGLDVICTILARMTPIKEAVSSFLLDGTLVLLGMILMRDVVNGLVGVLSAFACALAIQYIYVNAESFVIADIISAEYEAIRKYVQEQMDRSTTVIDATGGYSGQPKKLLRVAFSKRELSAFRAYIASVDPRAFVTFTQASMINGEGFDPLVQRHIHQINKKNNGDLNG